MPIDKPTVVDEAPKPRGFQPGHARVGGRKAGLPTKTKLAAEMCAKYKFHPLEWIVQAVKTGVAPAPDGKPGTQPVSMSDRTRLAETLLSFLLPRLSATQVTGANEGPIAVSTLDVTQLMQNPELAAAAQRVALGLIGYPPKQLVGGEDQ